MPDALTRLYNRYDGRVPKHLLEAALTGKTQVEIAIDTLNRQAKWNYGKARDFMRAARRAKMFAHPERVGVLLSDARFHRDAARHQRRQAARLAATTNRLLDNATLAGVGL